MTKRLIAPRLEDDHQRIVADHLDGLGVLWCHVPNELKLAGRASNRFAVLRKMRNLGVKRGVPDILVMDPPPSQPSLRAVAIELKRPGGKTTPEQDHWLAELASRGWYATVCYGHEDAIRVLKELGYERRHDRR